jgi:ribonuclease E
VASQAERAPRPERGERGERGEGRRGPRPERDAAATAAEPTQARGFADSVPADGATSDGEREGQRRRRRGGRGGRDRDEARADAPVNGEAPLGTETLAPEQSAGLSENVDTDREPMAVDTLPGAESGAARGEREGGRRRGRGRNRREGREGEGAAMEALAETGNGLAEPTQEPRAASEPIPVSTPVSMPQTAEARAVETVIVAAAPAVAVAVAASTLPEAAAPASAPVGRFELPIDDLRALASSAGLEWVNSDAERILVVQQAMANEPKPVHMPRTPRQRVVIDDGPLVLVETRKDLSQLKLPFEQQSPARQP